MCDLDTIFVKAFCDCLEVGACRNKVIVSFCRGEQCIFVVNDINGITMIQECLRYLPGFPIMGMNV